VIKGKRKEEELIRNFFFGSCVMKCHLIQEICAEENPYRVTLRILYLRSKALILLIFSNIILKFDNQI
jgi:hypothetical protein